MPRSALGDLVRRLPKPDADRPGASDRDLLAGFATGRDPEAFEVLVRRHARFVHAACRQVLSDPADIDDAFQATFLVLIRKAKSVTWNASLGGWLYAVAHRLAVRTRANAHKRHHREAAAARRSRRAADLPDLSWKEVCAILHEELDALPDRYRRPLLLCYLEGQSRDEAAGNLGETAGSVKGCLERGRRLLAGRLEKRGVALSAGLLAVLSGNAAAVDGPPSELVQLALTAATAGPTPAAATLANGAFPMTLAGKKTVAALVLMVGLVAAGLELAQPAGVTANPQPPAKAADPKAAGPPAEKAETFRYAGIVLDPAGKPLAGAAISISGLQAHVIEFLPRAKTGADGRFDFTVRRDEFMTRRPNDKPGGFVFIGATAPGCGAMAASAIEPGKREKLTFRLPAEQVVTGRVVNLEGEPVAGATIGYGLMAGKLDADGKPVAFDDPAKSERWLPNMAPHPDNEGGVTGADGKFTLRGVSRGWLYNLYIRGPGIATKRAQLVARPQKEEVTQGTGLITPGTGNPRLTRYGSEFTFVAAPAVPITGVVRDKATGKPLAGVLVGRPFVADPDPPIWATADKDGRFRIEGAAAGKHELRVDPDANQPYLSTRVTVDTTGRAGPDPVACAFDLPRQRVVVGRVTDRATGKPVAGAAVEYRPVTTNPNLKAAPDLENARWNSPSAAAYTDADGRFMVRTLPGPGVVLVRGENVYLPAVLAAPDKVAIPVLADDPELLDTRPFPTAVGDYHAVKAVTVAKDGPDTVADFTLDAGRSVPLVLRHPDAKPRETWAYGLTPPSFDRIKENAPTQDRVAGLVPGQSRRVFAVTRDGTLAGHTTLTGLETDPVTVTLGPVGTITGRLTDAAGKPLAEQAFQLYYDDAIGGNGVFVSWGFAYRLPSEAEAKRSSMASGRYGDRYGGFSMPEQSDADGRFRISGLVPDVPFDLWVVRIDAKTDPKTRQVSRTIVSHVKTTRVTVKPGETKDLGDVKVGK